MKLILVNRAPQLIAHKRILNLKLWALPIQVFTSIKTPPGFKDTQVAPTSSHMTLPGSTLRSQKPQK